VPVFGPFIELKLEGLPEFQEYVGQPIPVSRVKPDLWHLLDRYGIAKAHPARLEFSRRIRDAVAVLHLEDVERVIKVQMKKKGILKREDFDFPGFYDNNSKYVLARCRRTIAPPHITVPRIEEVYREFSGCLDEKGIPLFTKEVWEEAEKVLEHFRHGCPCDIPGVDLYEVIGTDRDGLSLYRCRRGEF
jgi:hypothetical protein